MFPRYQDWTYVYMSNIGRWKHVGRRSLPLSFTSVVLVIAVLSLLQQLGRGSPSSIWSLLCSLANALGKGVVTAYQELRKGL